MLKFGYRSTWKKLNQMIDEAMDGSFEESSYDETELSKLEIKWKRFLAMSKLSRQRIEEERTEIKELVSDISHQVKTPLSNILLYSQMLNEYVTDKTAKELAEEISKQSEKLDFLLQSLVKLSRLESGVFEFTQKPQNLFPMLSRIQKQALGKAESKEIEIMLEMKPEQNIQAVFDRKWTEEALGNLLDNAVKYSMPHNMIRIFVAEYELFVCIRIQDHGIGIPEDEIPLIFQRFYRGNEVRQKDGIGIGLYLARQIIEGQQGYIKVSSEHRKGTTFSVYLRKK